MTTTLCRTPVNASSVRKAHRKMQKLPMCYFHCSPCYDLRLAHTRLRVCFKQRSANVPKAIEAALDPILFEHRDMMYANSLETPLAL